LTSGRALRLTLGGEPRYRYVYGVFVRKPVERVQAGQ
jgi:hypothetical protein